MGDDSMRKLRGRSVQIAIVLLGTAAAVAILWWWALAGGRLSPAASSRPQAQQQEDVRVRPASGWSERVVEAFQAQHPSLGTDWLPELSMTKSVRSARAFQLTLTEGRIIDQAAVPGQQAMLYLVARAKQLDGQPLVRVDMVQVDPAAQTKVQAPVSLTYGIPEEAVRAATRLCGFTGGEAWLYSTVRSEEGKRLVEIHRFEPKAGTRTPLLNVLTTEEADSRPFRMMEAALSPDGSRLLLRDSRHGLGLYDMKTGESLARIDQTAEIHPGESFRYDSRSGLAWYSPGLFSSEAWLLDLRTGTAKQPFAAESGWVDAGTDESGSLLYGQLTTERAMEQVAAGTKRTLLQPNAVQVLDLKGATLQRFSLPKESGDCLEFAGAVPGGRQVVLRRFTVSAGAHGTVRKTTGWLLGDLGSGAMTPLVRVDVPNEWDRKDVALAGVLNDADSEAPGEQAFVHLPDFTYYPTMRHTRRFMERPGEDGLWFVDEQARRIFSSSLSRPDLIVAALSYKKYNWDNHDFVWSGGYVSRVDAQPDGDRMYFFQIN